MKLLYSRNGIALVVAFLVPSISNAEAQKFLCSFGIFANPEGIERVKDFDIEFAYDKLTEEAFMIGNNGVAQVFVVPGARAITFLEPLSSGTVQSTTIIENSSAVHSRHTVIGDDLVPSQYYGQCEVHK